VLGDPRLLRFDFSDAYTLGIERFARLPPNDRPILVGVIFRYFGNQRQLENEISGRLNGAQWRVRKVRSLQFRDMGWPFGGFQRVRERFERRHSVFMLVREIQDPAILRRAPGRLVRVSKETHRGRCDAMSRSCRGPRTPSHSLAGQMSRPTNRRRLLIGVGWPKYGCIAVAGRVDA
jgi:hypothetical protein